MDPPFFRPRALRIVVAGPQGRMAAAAATLWGERAANLPGGIRQLRESQLDFGRAERITDACADDIRAG